MSFIVAIDGPSGAGKGTVTSIVAKKNNLLYLDTGATYRCVTLRLLNEKIDFNNLDSDSNSERIKQILEDIKIEFKKEDNDNYKVFLDGNDVTRKIREKDVTNHVSDVAKLLIVREKMVELQRRIAEKQDSILEGRDIGTNVFPNADVKIYLDASVEERIKRRVKQNKEKNIEMSEEEVKENIIKRDNDDKNRKYGRLMKADDAIYIDSSNMTIDEVVNKISKIIKSKKKTYYRIQKGYIMTKETIGKKVRRKIVKVLLSAIYHIVYRIKIVGKENLKSDDGFIICANHLNTLDATGIVLFNKKEVRFVAKSDLFRSKLLLHFGHLFNVIPVKRNSGDIQSVKLCLKCLKDKKILGIFPEGTRKGLEKNTKIKNGATYIAYKAKAKIVPVGISGSFKPFTKVTFNYGKPIDVSRFKTEDPNWIDNATKYVMDEIIKLSKIK